MIRKEAVGGESGGRCPNGVSQLVQREEWMNLIEKWGEFNYRIRVHLWEEGEDSLAHPWLSCGERLPKWVYDFLMVSKCLHKNMRVVSTLFDFPSVRR